MIWKKGQIRKEIHEERSMFNQFFLSSSGVEYFPMVLVAIGVFVFWITHFQVELIATDILAYGIASGGFFLCAVGFALLKIRRRGKLNKLIQAAADLCLSETVSETDFSEFERQRSRAGNLPVRVVESFQYAYLILVALSVDDGNIDSNEHARILRTEEALCLPEEDIKKFRTQGYQVAFNAAVEDSELSKKEEENLNQIRRVLEVPDSAVHSELEHLQELSQARAIREGDLNETDVPISLQRGELAYYFTEAAERKKKVARTFTRNGVRHNEYEWVDVRRGSLYVTSKRLLLVSGGTTTIKLKKIMGVTVIPDERLLSVIKDGRQTPLFFEMSCPYIAEAYLKKAVSQNV